MRYAEKLIEGGDGVALDSAKASPAEMFSVLPSAYPLFIDTPIDFWETKQMPRMRCRMRCWQLTSTLTNSEARRNFRRG
jgi:hypothetical protein